MEGDIYLVYLKKIMKTKINLKNVEWGEFIVEKLFEIKNIPPYHKNNLIENTKSCKLPYISRTVLNNGLETFVENNNFSLVDKNCIVFWAESADFFYQPFEFIVWNKMYTLKKDWLNKHSYSFLIVAFRQSIKWAWFGYWKWLTWTRLKSRKILLPIDKFWAPDWDFMEKYIKQIEDEKLETLLSYYTQRCIENDLTLTHSLTHSLTSPSKNIWKEFEIGDIFEISGTTTTHPTVLEKWGRTPRITCAATDNWFEDTYQNPPTEKWGVLTVDSATVWFISFQENDFIATDHVEKIFLKNNQKMSKYLWLFLKVIISNATAWKYGYGYKFSQVRIKKQKIILPVDKVWNPDRNFMEEYMKKIEEKTLSEIIPYFEKRLEKAKILRGGGRTYSF